MDDGIVNVQFFEDSSVIKVIGVGGGGGNAVNYMFNQGICNVDFVICNTDKYALNKSPIPIKIQLGEKGLGAGNKPEIGRQAAIETLPKVQQMLEGTEMVFITAGMGGGTGTGAAPVIAQAAKEMGILTIGIVSIPFLFEGKNRVYQAVEGVEEMRKHVDAILIINNEKIRSLYGDLTLRNAFSKADNVLTAAAKGIAEIITVTGYINVDLNDVRTVMTDSGDAIMGAGRASGPDRAVEAIRESLHSPLLLSTDISGAKNILLNISYGEDEMTMDEIGILTDYLQKQVGPGTQIIWGANFDETLGDEINVTLVATGFALDRQTISDQWREPEDRGGQAPLQPDAEKAKKEEKNIDLKSYYGDMADTLAGKNPTTRFAKQKSSSTAPQEKRIVDLDLDDDSDVDRLENMSAHKRKQQGSGAYNYQHNPVTQEDISCFSIEKAEEEFPLKEGNDFLHNKVD
jgi:cell division protein FtsZ